MTVPNNDLLCVGRITSAHGVKGEVKVQSFMADPESILDHQVFYNKSRSETYKLTFRGRNKEYFLAIVNQISDRNQAELFRNKELYLPRDVLPPPAEGEFFQDDLVGMSVILEDSTVWGTVKAIHNFGAGNIIEVQQLDDTVYVPFTKETVRSVDVANKKMTLCLPENI